jgi:cytochrome d ubiquinol oxidase subunit II
VTFALGSTLVAIVLGAALGNVLRGVPLDATGTFQLPLFDSVWPGGRSGVLDAYTVLAGVFTHPRPGWTWRPLPAWRAGVPAAVP